MLTRFRAYRGNTDHAVHRYDDDLYRVWLAQPDNRDKTFADFESWLAEAKTAERQAAPDFVARFILAQF